MSGLCAHVQALCIVMADVQRNQRASRWATKPAAVELRTDIPLVWLVVQREALVHAFSCLVLSPSIWPNGDTPEQIVAKARNPQLQRSFKCLFCDEYTCEQFSGHVLVHIRAKHKSVWERKVPEAVRKKLEDDKTRKLATPEEIALFLIPNDEELPPPAADAEVPQQLDDEAVPLAGTIQLPDAANIAPAHQQAAATTIAPAPASVVISGTGRVSSPGASSAQAANTSGSSSSGRRNNGGTRRGNGATPIQTLQTRSGRQQASSQECATGRFCNWR
jgi:hypothetical protein